MDGLKMDIATNLKTEVEAEAVKYLMEVDTTQIEADNPHLVCTKDQWFINKTKGIEQNCKVQNEQMDSQI